MHKLKSYFDLTPRNTIIVSTMTHSYKFTISLTHLYEMRFVYWPGTFLCTNLECKYISTIIFYLLFLGNFGGTEVY